MAASVRLKARSPKKMAGIHSQLVSPTIAISRPTLLDIATTFAGPAPLGRSLRLSELEGHVIIARPRIR